MITLQEMLKVVDMVFWVNYNDHSYYGFSESEGLEDKVVTYVTIDGDIYIDKCDWEYQLQG